MPYSDSGNNVINVFTGTTNKINMSLKADLERRARFKKLGITERTVKVRKCQECPFLIMYRQDEGGEAMAVCHRAGAALPNEIEILEDNSLKYIGKVPEGCPIRKEVLTIEFE